MAKIAIDCDGVLADFNKAFTDMVNSIWPGKIEEGFEPHDWDFDGRLTSKEMSKVWAKIRATENFWLRAPAYSTNVGALARWFIMNTNQDVYIVTSRAKTAGMTVARQTDMWLSACGLDPLHNYLAVLPVDDSNEKWRVYMSGGFDYSIDDKAETVEQCDMIHPHLATHKAFLLDRPWNQHGVVQRRIMDMGAFLKEIK